MDLDGRRGSGGTGRSRGEETMIRGYYMKKNRFSLKDNERMAAERQKGKMRKQKPELV